MTLASKRATAHPFARIQLSDRRINANWIHLIVARGQRVTHGVVEAYARHLHPFLLPFIHPTSARLDSIECHRYPNQL